MLLKLIPPPSQPTIHFSISLPTLPPHLEPPSSYTAQINHLLVEDLEIPNSLHSLDKSVGLMSLLEEVTFEIKDGTGHGGGGGGEVQLAVHVSCRFVDGALEDWVTEAAGLISALESIIHNVRESTLEDDKEHERYRQSQLQSRALNIPPSPTPLLSMTGIKPRHKKQRSLFMQIVSSIVNLTSTSSSSSSHLPTFVDPSHPESFYSPPPPPTFNTPVPTPPSSDLARFLRRTARSNLVNTYRRHVLPELTRRFPKEGGFGVWILHSMRRRALKRMEDLIQEGARLQQQQQQQQQVLELRQRHEHEEWEQKQQYACQQERAKSPIQVDERLFRPRFSVEEGEFSATTMAVPLSFSDEGGSTESENESANLSRNGNGNSEAEDDLETITDGSSIRTPSSTSHIGIGFMGDSCSSPTSTTNTQPPGLPVKSPLSNPWPTLPPHFRFEYSKLSYLRQHLQSLILFADSQIRIAEDEKRNRDEILLVRGRRRAWLNGELGVGSATGTGNGMQWGFAAPFKSSPLARYSWSASAEADQSMAYASDANLSVWLPDVQHQQADEEDEDEYDEFHGPPAVRRLTLSYGRRSRRSRYITGGSGNKLLPVTEEFEYQNSTSDNVDDTVQPPGLDDHPDDSSFHHGDDAFVYRLQEDEDVDSSSDGFSLEDPRELDLELGFGLQEPISFDGEELLRDDDGNYSEQVGVQEHGQGRSGESTRIAFEMERPKIIPRVRDGLVGGDDDSIMSVGTSSSTSTRSGGLLSWGYWGVGKNSGNSDGDGASRRYRSWKNGIGIGLGSRGRSLNKTCRQREEEEEQLPRLRRCVSTSSTSSTASTSSTKSQQQQSQHQREPAQVDFEPELHQNQDQNKSCSPLLCQPVSFSVSHIPAQAATQPAGTSTVNAPTTSTPTVTITSRNDTLTSPTENLRGDTPTVAANSTKTFVPVPLSFTTKKLCMGSPAPNVYADLDVSVVHVGDDDKGLSLAFGANQNVNPGLSHIDTGSEVQGGPGHCPRLRPRRHKREYQYHHTYGDKVYNGQDECNDFELAGYGQFTGSDTQYLFSPKSHHQQQHQQRHNSMIHARLHLDELLLEEGLFSCDTGSPSDQEEFTLAMDVPLSSGRRSGRKALRKMQYLQLQPNRDSVASPQQSHLQLEQQLDHHPVSSSSVLSPFATERSLGGSVAC